ncbi:probable helicase senataxin isoform X6 [Rhinolophus ferrumequinum]|uniref:probable helicase senataxin isoform X6 n=1 Tax=Rhinolophus ferrumequinum TaxID=59479 RepID=UPI00140FB47B|nr:probable helicase senataxin isoform X6 [Rhinolophus ferrumequinum]
MSTCCWCTPGGVSTIEFLKLYASRTQPSEFQTADEDLCYCLECVTEYHKARDELPFLHEVLWELETLRLINHFEKSMKAEIEDDDELYIVDINGEEPLFDMTGQDFENKLRVPLLEMLKYPYLLLHERVNELCVEALCRMEQANCSFQVFEKHPGVYLFLVHPNEMVRRWAILTAKGLGKVDRDDYYDLQEVLTCLFKVIELGLLESPDIYTSSVLEKGKLILLPSHMYDATNYKNYWLGICMLLTILEEQAMESLLLGSDKENDFMQSILHTMEKQSDDERGDPFWPALHCFMVILDRLGSKVWGQLIDPFEAFLTIINNVSYNREIQNIRKSSVRTKLEPESYLDDMVTCSQIVYNYNPEKTKKDSGWRSAVCPDYCPNMYEEMETLASVLQSDIGQDMRVHNSTFLWFIPFVQSLMDLKDLGVPYIVEVIHHLHSEVKVVLNEEVVVCDKVTEFFFLILVSVIELHRNKKCLHLLWVSSQKWVEAVVKCAKLPTSAFARSSEKSSSSGSKGTPMVSSVSLHSMPSNSVQLACVQLIRSLLKEGYQLGQQTLCKQFWDKLNLFLRGNLSLGWQLTSQETQELQTCLTQIIKNIKFKVPQCNAFVDLTLCKPAPACSCKEESEHIGKKCKNVYCLESSSSTLSKEPVKADACQVQESGSSKASNTVKENNEQNYIEDSKLEDHLSAESRLKQSSKNLFTEGSHDQVKRHTVKQKSVNNNSSYTPQNCPLRNGPERRCDRGRGMIMSPCLLTDSSTDSLEKVSTSNEDFSSKNDIGETSKAKSEAQKGEICAKLSHVIQQYRKSISVDNAVKSEGNLTVSDMENFSSRKTTGGQEGDSFLHNLSLDRNGILDNKNGEQKSHNSLLLKKKQVKNEELDVFSSHENDCQIQECHTDKDLISFTEMTSTFVHEASPFKDPVTVLESREKEMSKSTDRVSSKSREQTLSSCPKSDTLTDSLIDLHKLSLVAQASVSKFPSDSPEKHSSQLQKKVKDKRSFTANRKNVRETCHGQIIIISDSDDDGDDERILDVEKHIKQDKICIKEECPQQHTSIANMNVDRKLIKKEKTNSPSPFEECDSQVFEFESQQDVFSVWQDQKPDNKNSVQEDGKNSWLTHMADITNDWGYDTDYPMSEEVTTEGPEGVEEHAGPQSSRMSVEEPMKAKYASQRTDSPHHLNQCNSVVLNGRTATNEITLSTSEDPSGGGDLTVHLEVAALQKGEPEPRSDVEEDKIFLTQCDPEDMDLCSQMQNDNDKLIEVVHGQETVQVEDFLSWPQLESLSGTKCKYKDCLETMKNQGEYCPKHIETKAADEDVFRKPALPLSALKPLRPSTTKIFSSSTTSRTAHLSRSLENAPTIKNKTNGVHSVMKAPLPACVVSQKPVGEMKSLCNVLRSPTPSNSNRQGYKLPLGERKPFSACPVNILFSSQSISDAFIKEILKWKYEMFVNFDQCGPPAGLCQAISRPVPIRFQDYGDYFDVFFPLLILNTFETVAQEWSSSPNKEKLHQLRLRKFPADYKKYWEFVVYLDESELAKQLHPKENDLVFLVLERLNGEKKDMRRNPLKESQAYHCGYIHKFRRTSAMRNGKSECSLFIQSQDNLPVNLNEFVKCIVISSLVTTQRKLKAMCLLSGRNQLARAILNPNPMDFCTKDLLTKTSDRITADLKDFNEDQKKAMETAYAMVKHSPSVAKICLIHGPPGTGKSKTIVGLLRCLLTENLRKGHSDENSNAKIKQNRVLVCAPSNAAVDELMKKIIVEFKENCKDKNHPLGNCGDINLVRLGAEKSINSEVLKFSLDHQVDHRMKKELPSHVQEMHRRKEYLDHQLDELSRQRALCRGGREIQPFLLQEKTSATISGFWHPSLENAERQEFDEKIAEVSKERQELASKIKEVQGRPQKTQNIIILESHVICCTLSTSGGLLLESAFRGQGGVPFSCVIVDEAGQSCEVETLTPLIHRCNKLVLVGDPKQLPPTVISLQKAQEYGYDQSMMARFYKLLEDNVERNMSGRLPVVQLSIQYRMHPDICLFPSTYIYNKSLKTDRMTETKRCSSDWLFQPYLVFDVGDGSERRDNDSYVNVQEIKLVMEIIKLIKEKKKKDTTFRSIGIITHYKAQKMMIQKELDKEFDGKRLAEVDTVDAFQGRQKNCVIVTCVRANAMQGSIGFLASLQRLNVTITRAKYSLFILGHLRTLMENQHWNHLIQDAQRRGAIIKTCDKSYKHDATKILKLRPILQRSLTHPPTTAPEVPRSPGGLPGNKPDAELAKTSFTSLCHTPSDSKEAAVTAAAKDPERPPAKDQLRDPRLLRRLGLSPEAPVRCLRDPQPSSPQCPAGPPPLGETGFPVSPQALGSLVEPPTAPGSSHRPPGPCEPPAVSTETATDPRKCDQAGEPSHRRDTRAVSEGDRERWSQPPKRNSGWDSEAPDEEDSSSSKKRKLL